MKIFYLLIIVVLLKLLDFYIYVDIPFFNSILDFIVIIIISYMFLKLLLKKNKLIFIIIFSSLFFYFTFRYNNVDFRSYDYAILSIDKQLVKSIDTLYVNNYCNTYLIQKRAPLIYSKERVFISIEQSKKNNTGNDITWLYSKNNEIIKVDRNAKTINIKKSKYPLKDNIYLKGKCDCFIKNFIETL